MEVLLIYILVVNVLSFILTGYDKYLAIKNKHRIPEKTLFTIGLLGGSLGLLIAMVLFKHKTSKSSFIVKFGGIIFVQILFVISILNYKR
ncbi:DUF1294 domain-containing protein [Flavobacterium sp. F-65]|jgi:uncharacterized membrane protein YsdA (DUF1294 family)|uniref:DUF1294 domain-containing protein n=1 Tax=Flavobacterium pisciphilum TaxID=2893755 RepID=A0ABS8MUQ2_9FLAO|nr:DUF1294 domain-containing protein [Flavobacterium sp. F-65]MCC9072388.1 DUF1294 domain-containing protein [Flavobacterium sp. F-65]